MGSEVFNGHSMAGPLRRVMVCSPANSGWNDGKRASHWPELGFLHKPDFPTAQLQHEALCRELEVAGAEVMELPPSEALTLDAVYAHDASLPTDYGVILMLAGKANRVDERQVHAEFFRSCGIPVLGKVEAPGSSEAGDIVWVDADTLLVGNGYRTNALGITQLRELLAPEGVEVISAALPYGAGPSACLHLMSLMSVLDEKTVLVDLPWLSVETVESLRNHGYRFVEIDASERATLACNVLSLGGGRVLALEENQRTNRRLRDAGFDVRTFPGSELCINGSGGPTCLTRPLLRG
jgi:N-dimethylarginine dimethylaminohydrolase